MYKKSLYNIEERNYAGDYFIYNTLHNTWLSVPSGYYSIYERDLYNIVNDTLECGQVISKDTLLELGFIVESRQVESDMAINKKKTMLHNPYLFLTILPTEKCNFRCPYCFETFSHGKMSEQLIDKIIKKLTVQLKNYKGLILNWFGGEPLLEIDIIVQISEKMKKICNELKIPYLASITTNGYNLTYNNYMILKKYHITTYIVTIDGLPDYHNKTRVLHSGQGTFDKIINNLQTIRDKDNSQTSKFIIRTNFTKDSYRCKNQWEDFLEKEFLIDKRFHYLPRYAWNNNNSIYEENQFIDFDFDDNIDILSFYKFDNSNENHYYNMKYLEHIDREIVFKKVLSNLSDIHNGSNICAAGLPNSLIIGSDGTLYKCQVALDMPENKVGTILDNHIEIEYNERINNWVRKVASCDTCIKCSLFPMCFGIGCPAKTNDYEKSGWCQKFRKEINRKVRFMTYNNNISLCVKTSKD